MLPVRNLRRKHKAVRQEQSWKYDNMLYASYSKMFGYEKKKLEKKREETALTCQQKNQNGISFPEIHLLQFNLHKFQHTSSTNIVWDSSN